MKLKTPEKKLFIRSIKVLASRLVKGENEYKNFYFMEFFRSQNEKKKVLKFR